MATDKPKFTVIVDKEINRLIEDYRHKYNVENEKNISKSAATAKLIELGLQYVGLFKQTKE